MYLPAILSPGAASLIPQTALSGLRGLGCGCGCNGAAGGCGEKLQGLAGWNMDGSGLLGTGLFSAGLDGPLDVSQWSMAEWAVLGLAGFAAYSMFFTARTGGRAARGRAKSAKAGIKRAGVWPWVALGAAGLAIGMGATKLGGE